jgi:hypothetical protein
MSLATLPGNRAAHWAALTIVVALAMLPLDGNASLSLLTANQLPGSTNETLSGPPPRDAAGVSKAVPLPPSTAKMSNRELVKRRMLLCRRRPELCVQQRQNKAAGAHKPPAAGQVDK